MIRNVAIVLGLTALFCVVGCASNTDEGQDEKAPLPAVSAGAVEPEMAVDCVTCAYAQDACDSQGTKSPFCKSCGRDC